MDKRAPAEDQSRQACPCKKTKCERHGRCGECRAYHDRRGDPPWCERVKRARHRDTRQL